MKNFLYALFIFFLLACCQSTLAGPLVNSAQFEKFNFNDSNAKPELVYVNVTFDDHKTAMARSRLYINPIINQIGVKPGVQSMREYVLASFDTHWYAPLVDYGLNPEAFFPDAAIIELVYRFDPNKHRLSARVVAWLVESGLSQSAAQKLYYEALDASLGLVILP